MSRTCSFDGCTFDDTGICALTSEPSTCTKRVSKETTKDIVTENDSATDENQQPPELLGAPVLAQPENMSSLASSRALGLVDVNSMMRSRYVNVVGILGEPESGKTACLASLYLLISHAKLDGWSFSDSRSLAAFEEIARGARDWNNAVAPEQMTAHTELADDHGAGFLHLRLTRILDSRRFDLILPDIPGEWTQDLVTSARADRLDFMKSADTIWIVLDGRILANVEKRQGLIARVGQLAERLNNMLESRIPKLLIVVTHRDLHEVSDEVVKRIKRETTRRRVDVEIVNVAPFSDKPEQVAPGFGLAKLIDMTVGDLSVRPIFWKSTPPLDVKRVYLSYRK
jgi:hypothetical protein